MKANRLWAPVLLVACGGHCGSIQVSLTSLIAQFDKCVTGVVLDFRWMNLCYTLTPPLPHRRFFGSVWGDSWKFRDNLKICKKNLLLQWPQNMPGAVFRHLKFGRKWKGIKKDGEELLILDLGARFQMQNLISTEEVRARRLCLLFSSGEDVEVPHVCSCVCSIRSEGVDSLICKRMCGDTVYEQGTAWVKGENRDKSSPDCSLFLCTILRQRALNDCQQAILWASQYPPLNTSQFLLPLLAPWFWMFPHYLFIFSSWHVPGHF